MGNAEVDLMFGIPVCINEYDDSLGMRQSMDEERRNKAITEAIEGGRFSLGTSRKPVFGEQIRGIWAGENNPIRDGLYVKTIIRTGRVNPGTFYRLTDGKGKFWDFLAKDTIFLKEAKPQDKDQS